MPLVIHDYPLLRRVLFPFYGSHDIAVLIELITSVPIIMLTLDVYDEAFLSIILMSGYIGAVIASNGSSPATLVIDNKYLPKIERILVCARYSKASGIWSRNGPGYRRWPGNKIAVTQIGSVLRVSGPYNVLKQILYEIEGRYLR